MPDFDLSRLDAAFADMRSETAPFVTSPGFAAAQATARRRGRARAAALTGLAAALVVLPVAAYATWNQDRATPPVLAPTPTAATTTPAASPTPSPSTTPSQQPVSPATAATGSSGTRRLIDEPLGYTPIWVEGAVSGLTSYLPQGDSNTVSIGVKVMANKGATNVGSAHNVKLTVDLSQVAGGVEITAVGSPCTISGSIVRCSFGTLPVGERRVQLTLRARPEAALGRVGQVSLEVTGDELSWHTKEAYGWVEIR